MLITLSVIYTLNFICFFAAWIVGLVNAKKSYLEVLSYFLANDPEARIVYLVWFITYVIWNLTYTYPFLTNDIAVTDNSADEVHSDSVCCSIKIQQKFYIVFTIIFLPVNFLRLFAFFLLYNFDMKTFGPEHYIWTGIALIGSTVCCSCLLIRRICSRLYPFIHKWVYPFLLFNACTIIVQIVFICLLPSAPDNLRGTFELVVAVFIGIDPIYQIIDVYNDYICNSTLHRAATVNHVLAVVPKMISIIESVKKKKKVSSTQYSITTSEKPITRP